MRLTLGNLDASAEVKDEGTVRSPQTGRDLHTATVRIRGSGDDKQQEVEELLKGQSTTLTDPESGRVYGFRLATSTTSNTGVWSFTLELTERENLLPTAVVVDGIRLIPTRYAESAEQDELITIQMRTKTQGEQTELLEDQLANWRAFRPVIREGVQDQPRSMRFGPVCTWSSHGEVTKYQLTLVEEGFDEINRRTATGKLVRALMSGPEKKNAEKLLLDLEAQVGALLAALEEAGVLDANATAAVRAREATPRAARRLLRVDDVDNQDWLSDEGD
ncbi:MAG TPA: hypothetical protein VGR26_15695 [Acidimicrobiales bacterium]|nr:hypothetical protein [Acidimicrobiales bacterium]